MYPCELVERQSGKAVSFFKQIGIINGRKLYRVTFTDKTTAEYFIDIDANGMIKAEERA